MDLSNKTLKQFSKTLNFSSFFLECVSDCIFGFELAKRSIYGFFGKRDVFFFRKKHLPVFRNSENRYYHLDCVSKGSIAYKISKHSKLPNLELFGNIDVFPSENTFESFQEHFDWQFLSRKCVRFSNCLGILKTFKFLGFWEKWMLFLRRSKFSSKIGKRGIFVLAYVSNSVFAQENSDCSKKWEIREKWRVFT